MKVTAITIRPGHVLELENRLMQVIRIELIQPGKGNAVIQVEMKDIRKSALPYSGDCGACSSGRVRNAVFV
jgi:translation elongation factor P/translation initiation factor 5A